MDWLGTECSFDLSSNLRFPHPGHRMMRPGNFSDTKSTYECRHNTCQPHSLTASSTGSTSSSGLGAFQTQVLKHLQTAFINPSGWRWRLIQPGDTGTRDLLYGPIAIGSAARIRIVSVVRAVGLQLSAADGLHICLGLGHCCWSVTYDWPRPPRGRRGVGGRRAREDAAQAPVVNI